MKLELPEQFLGMIKEAWVPNVLRKRARYLLALVALYRLCDDQKHTLKELMARPNLEFAKDPVPKPWAKEANSKSWQRQFINTLVENGWVSVDKDTSYLYWGVDEDALLELVNDAVEGGTEVKRILWPGAHPEPETEEEILEEVDPSPEPGDETGTLALVQDIAAHLKTVATSILVISKRTEDVAERVERIEKTVTQVSAQQVDGLDQMKTALASLSAQVFDENRKALMGVITTLTESSSRHKSALRQLESSSRREETLLTSLETLVSSMRGGSVEWTEDEPLAEDPPNPFDLGDA